MTDKSWIITVVNSRNVMTDQICPFGSVNVVIHRGIDDLSRDHDKVGNIQQNNVSVRHK